MNIRFAASSALLAGVILLAQSQAFNVAAPTAGAAQEEPKSSWRTGPVKYLLTADEDKAFKALKTDDDRQKAIDEFWAKRDPSPGTPQNEYRDAFWKRVTDVNANFREGSGPGWLTDRGRMLLTAGPPDSMSGQGEDREIWTYARPMPAPATGEKVTVPAGGFKVVFTKGGSGEYRVSLGEEVVNDVRALDPLVAAAYSMPGFAPKGAAAPAGGEAVGGAPGAAAAPAPEVLAPGVDRLRQAVQGPEPKGELALEAAARYFKAVDGSTRTLIVLAIKKGDIAAGTDGKPATVLYARLQPTDAPDSKPLEFLDQEIYTLYDDAAEGWLKYAISWPLKRRSYELRAAVSDGPAGKIGVRVQTLTLPDFKSDALMLSSITLAKISLPAAAPPDAAATPGATLEDQFLVGSLRLVPWVKPVIGPKDDLAFFFDVYNARKDPATNKPSLDVLYVFEMKMAGVWKRRAALPLPDQREEVLGYTISSEALAKWPAGEWRLTVQVKDKVAEKDKVPTAEVSSTVEFSVQK